MTVAASPSLSIVMQYSPALDQYYIQAKRKKEEKPLFSIECPGFGRSKLAQGAAVGYVYRRLEDELDWRNEHSAYGNDLVLKSLSIPDLLDCMDQLFEKVCKTNSLAY